MKSFFAGTTFGSFDALSKAAKPYNAKVVRAKKGSRQLIIHYESIETLAKIIFNASRNS